jgi:hypothetical protein
MQLEDEMNMSGYGGGVGGVKLKDDGYGCGTAVVVQNNHSSNMTEETTSTQGEGAASIALSDHETAICGSGSLNWMQYEDDLKRV